MKIMALDVSASNTGFAIFENKKLTHAGYIYRNVNGKIKNDFRKWEFLEKLEKKILSYKPDLILIEEQNVFLYFRSVKCLSELHGILKKFMWKNNLPYVMVNHTAIKRYFNIHEVQFRWITKPFEKDTKEFNRALQEKIHEIKKALFDVVYPQFIKNKNIIIDIPQIKKSENWDRNWKRGWDIIDAVALGIYWIENHYDFWDKENHSKNRR